MAGIDTFFLLYSQFRDMTTNDDLLKKKQSDKKAIFLNKLVKVTSCSCVLLLFYCRLFYPIQTNETTSHLGASCKQNK